MFACYLYSFSISLSVGSIGDLDGGEDNPPDDVSLSGEEAGASDQDDSAECDESSPSFAPLYNEGKENKPLIQMNHFALIALKDPLLWSFSYPSPQGVSCLVM